MKTFHIKTPHAGEPSAPVVSYHYDPESRRTRTIYLGRVRVDAHPERPEAALCLTPGAAVGGVPFVPTAEHLRAVSAWLEARGTFRRAERAAALAAQQERERRQSEERELEGRIRAALKTELEAQWRAEFDAALDPLEAADAALARAAEQVRREATELKAHGERLTRLRSVGQDPDRCAPALDRLQARANRLRLAQFSAFVAACQDAGLVGRKRRGIRRTRTPGGTCGAS